MLPSVYFPQDGLGVGEIGTFAGQGAVVLSVSGHGGRVLVHHVSRIARHHPELAAGKVLLAAETRIGPLAHVPCFFLPSCSICVLCFSIDLGSTIQTLANFSPVITPLLNRLRIWDPE